MILVSFLFFSLSCLSLVFSLFLWREGGLRFRTDSLPSVRLFRPALHGAGFLCSFICLTLDTSRFFFYVHLVSVLVRGPFLTIGRRRRLPAVLVAGPTSRDPVRRRATEAQLLDPTSGRGAGIGRLRPLPCPVAPRGLRRRHRHRLRPPPLPRLPPPLRPGALPDLDADHGRGLDFVAGPVVGHRLKELRPLVILDRTHARLRARVPYHAVRVVLGADEVNSAVIVCEGEEGPGRVTHRVVQ